MRLRMRDLPSTPVVQLLLLTTLHRATDTGPTEARTGDELKEEEAITDPEFSQGKASILQPHDVSHEQPAAPKHAEEQLEK